MATQKAIAITRPKRVAIAIPRNKKKNRRKTVIAIPRIATARKIK